ncbi:MAG TPA: glycosyl hydrolase [Steroidobacteraceae bacterium]
MLAQPAAATPQHDALLEGFQHPPLQARPQLWWHWMNGNVDLAGAKLDLEWMQRIGIGGVHTFTGGGLGEPHVIDPPVDFLSDTWRAAFRETTRLACASGMEVTIAGSPGWSETGGIWVAPENAMKKYTWSETQVLGGALIDLVLARPPAATGPFLGVKRTFNPAPQELRDDVYQDSMVVAFPTPAAELADVAPAFFANDAPLNLSPLRAGDLSANVSVPLVEERSSVAIDAAFEQPTRIAALTLGLAKVADVEVQAGDDTSQLRSLLKAAADPSETPAPEQTYSFAPTRARVFRVILTRPAPKPLFPDLPPRLSKPPTPPKAFVLTRLELSGGARVNRFESKAGFQSSIDAQAPATAAVDRDAVIPLSSVVDLTDQLDAQGRLRWNAPPGRWTVLRLGWSLTGQTNGPAQTQDTGLEVDKLDAQRVRDYVEHYLSIYRDAMQDSLGKDSVGSLLTDSWEAGVQNWTPTLLAQFKARRGYDPLPYLPVLVGRVVADAATSERFLWDFHRTLEEALAENHYGVIAQVLHEHGMRYYTEAQGDTPRAIGDGMAIKSRADIPTAEYWYRAFATAPGQPSLQADLREAASAAHIYGKPIAAAESLTVAAGTDPWAFSPAMLKTVADEIFASGINRILLHESHHQPLLHEAPGLTLGFFGQFFTRNDTWAEDAAPWIDYLARTSYLLQQGDFAADVLYFYGEERNLTEIYLDRFDLEVPEGYGYDYVNAEALLSLVSQRDGTVRAPSGLRYRMVYVPPYVTRYSLPILRKLRELVASGAVVVATRPTGGLGILSSDDEVSALTEELWGPVGAPTGVRRFGQGRLYAQSDLSTALDAEAIAADVAAEPCQPQCRIRSVHRRTPEADIYFLLNKDDGPRATRMTFRVGNRVPELWRADTGRTEPLASQRTAHGVAVPLVFGAHEAFFVVFRPASTRPKAAHRVRSHEILRVLGPWQVRFQSGRGAPPSSTFPRLADWRISSDEGIKYFSGAATYTASIRLPALPAASRRRMLLDLGEVHELAVVFLDGVALGTAWHAPFEIELPQAAARGTHELEIRVDNLWVNRLVGDQQPGANAVAFAPQSPYTANSPLMQSGLLGPVRILVAPRNKSPRNNDRL